MAGKRTFGRDVTNVRRSEPANRKVKKAAAGPVLTQKTLPSPSLDVTVEKPLPPAVRPSASTDNVQRSYWLPAYVAGFIAAGLLLLACYEWPARMASSSKTWVDLAIDGARHGYSGTR